MCIESLKKKDKHHHLWSPTSAGKVIHTGNFLFGAKNPVIRKILVENWIVNSRNPDKKVKVVRRNGYSWTLI